MPRVNALNVDLLGFRVEQQGCEHNAQEVLVTVVAYTHSFYGVVSRSLTPYPSMKAGLRTAHEQFLTFRRGTQVVRERSAKPLYVSSILTRASNAFDA
jgi:hypothetical protein